MDGWLNRCTETEGQISFYWARPADVYGVEQLLIAVYGLTWHCSQVQP